VALTGTNRAAGKFHASFIVHGASHVRRAWRIHTPDVKRGLDPRSHLSSQESSGRRAQRFFGARWIRGQARGRR
jgi:hypothetical protein